MEKLASLQKVDFLDKLHKVRSKRAAAKSYWPCVMACAEEHTARGNSVVRGMSAGAKAISGECEAQCSHLPDRRTKQQQHPNPQGGGG